MGHNRDGGIDHGAYVTHAQAATILGIHVSNVAGLVQRGELTTRGKQGRGASLDRAQVEQLARDRATQAAARARRRAARQQPPDPRPDLEHDWLTCTQAAQLIGITTQAVAKRLRKGTMPGVRHRGQWWVQAEHAQVAANIRAVGDDPSTLPRIATS